MKKLSLIFTTLLICTVFIFSSCAQKPAPPEETFYTVTYIAEEGGTIQGQTPQTVKEGDDGVAVTAKPKLGYEFAGWSDGLKSDYRKEQSVTGDITVTATFKRLVFSLNYSAGEHGKIIGETEQQLFYGQSGTVVTAVADENYEFKGWSDGVKTAERKDEGVTRNISVTANFEEQIYTYSLEYNFGKVEGGETPAEISFTYFNFKETKFPVPVREHFTFNGWYKGESKVADTSGAVTAQTEILEEDGALLSAKWTANQTFEHKVLIVYVTKIDANLMARDNSGYIRVDYEMSQTEYEFYKLMTVNIREILSTITDGLVDFIVDEYFTTQTVYAESFSEYGEGNDTRNKCIDAYNIPEVYDAGMCAQYDSIITVFGMNDIDYKLHRSGGAAKARYGTVYLDSFLSGLRSYELTLEECVEALKRGEDVTYAPAFGDLPITRLYMYGTFVHELAHTIERNMIGNPWKYHATLGQLWDKYKMREIEATRYYFLNEIVMDGEKVGISYEFWDGTAERIFKKA